MIQRTYGRKKAVAEEQPAPVEQELKADDAVEALLAAAGEDAQSSAREDFLRSWKKAQRQSSSTGTQLRSAQALQSNAESAMYVDDLEYNIVSAKGGGK